jgi:hypothetical protein
VTREVRSILGSHGREGCPREGRSAHPHEHRRLQGNQAFVDAFYADVFRQWTPDELIAVALERSLACQPGACFN